MAERAFLSYDNAVTITAFDGDEAQNISFATKVVVVLGGGITLDSDANPSYFDLTGLVLGDVKLTLGQSTVPAGIYKVRFVTYDPAHPNGLVWAHETDAEPVLLQVV